MALRIGDFVEEFGSTGIIVGVGAVILAPVLIPVIAKVAKPVAKTAIKGGIVLYEKTKGLLAEAGEVLEDIVAESRAELAEQKALSPIEVHPEMAD